MAAAPGVGDDGGAVLTRGLNLVQGSAQADLVRVGAVPLEQDVLVDLGEGQDGLYASLAHAPVLVDLREGIVRADEGACWLQWNPNWVLAIRSSMIPSENRFPFLGITL